MRHKPDMAIAVDWDVNNQTCNFTLQMFAYLDQLRTDFSVYSCCLKQRTTAVQDWKTQDF